MLFTALIISTIQQPTLGAYANVDQLHQNTLSMPLNEEKPLGPQGQPLDAVETLLMPPVDVEKYLEEDRQRTFDEPPRFAITIPQMVDPHTKGTWETLTEDLMLWRVLFLQTQNHSTWASITTIFHQVQSYSFMNLT